MKARKLSSLFLLFLIFNLNVVVPGVSYAVSEETCSCHFNSADRKCHCDNSCKSCGHGQDLDEKGQMRSEVPSSVSGDEIKGWTCSSAAPKEDAAVSVLGLPFLISSTGFSEPVVIESLISIFTKDHIKGRTIPPSERPPAV